MTEEETANPDIAPEEELPVKRRRKEGWTKTAYDELEAAEMIGRKRRAKAEDNLKLVQHDEEQQANYYPYIVPPHVVDEPNPIRREPIKLPSLPTVAHNYTFWGDLIFKPKSRVERDAPHGGGDK